MADNSSAPVLYKPTGLNAVQASNSKQLSLKDAASKLQRKKKENVLNKEKITTGALNYVPVLFPYADGQQGWIRVQKDTVKKLGIRKPPEGTITATGVGITYDKTKPVYVSYGFKIVTRKKQLGGRATKRTGNTSGKTQVRAWIQLSVPHDATFLDICNFAKSFGKPPGLVKSGTQQFLLNYSRATGGAGAAK